MSDVFNVLTEFRFDAGSAILQSNHLQDAVHGISNAADEANIAFQRLGAGLVGHMDLFHGGLIGGLIKSIEVSDKFNLAASSFANIIQANMSLDPKFNHMIGNVDTFNERLETSKQILMDIHNVAAKFGLDEVAMVETTKGLGAVLAPMGHAGKNFSTAIDLSRMSMKAAPTLGVQPQFMQQEMVNILTGKANQTDTLFRRLLSDTQTMKPFQQNGGMGFNALPAAKKVELLTKALNEFSRDSEVAEFNMRSLHNQLTILRNEFLGFASVLKPIGDLLLPIVQTVLVKLNHYIEHDGRKAIENIAKMFEPLTRNPMRQVETVMQLKKLPEDIHTAHKIIELFGVLNLLNWVLGLVGVSTGILGKGLTTLEKTMFHISEKALPNIGKGLLSAFTGGSVAEGLGQVAAGLFEFVSSIFGMLFKLVFILQIITRGLAIAKLRDLEFLSAHMPIITEIFSKFSQAIASIMRPLSDGIEAIAGWIGWLLSFGYFSDLALRGVNLLADGFIILANALTVLESGLASIFAALGSFMGNMAQGNFLDALMTIPDAIKEAGEDYLSKNLIQDKQTTVHVAQNIASVVIRNDFKENMQPDRVAFTIADQLKKVAQNSTQGRSNTFAGHALTGGLNQ